MATWAYLYDHPDTDPVADQVVLDRAGQRTLLVPVADSAAAPAIARRLIDAEGVGLIELCGGFATADVAAVAAEVGEDAAVGHVTFSVDALAAAGRYAAEANS